MSTCSCVFFGRFIPESPRWSASNGKGVQVMKYFRTSAKVNGKTLPSDVKIVANNRTNVSVPRLLLRGLETNFCWPTFSNLLFLTYFQWPASPNLFTWPIFCNLILLTHLTWPNLADHFFLTYFTQPIFSDLILLIFLSKPDFADLFHLT